MTTNPADRAAMRRLAIPIYAPVLLFGFGQGCVLALLPLGARAFGASTAAAAAVVMLVGMGSMIANVPASLVTARLGERRAITWASVACASALVAAGTATHVLWYAFAILALGMSGSVFGVARHSHLTIAVPFSMRARAMSTLGGVLRVGLFAGPFVGALAATQGGAWTAYLVAAASTLAAGAVSRGLPDLPPAGSDPADETVHAGLSRQSTLRDLLRTQGRVFLTAGIGIALVAAVRATRQVAVPLWADHLGLDAAGASLIVGVSGAVDMAVFYPAGKVMDTVGRAAVAVPSMAVMGVGLLVMPWTTTVTGLLTAALILGLGNGLGSGLLLTLGADFAPERDRALFLGLWRLEGDIGGALGPAILAALTAALSLTAGVLAVAALAAVGAGVLWAALPRDPRPGVR